MELYSTLEEAIDAAREAFLENEGVSEEDASVAQFSLQRYVMRDGEVNWQAEFHAEESEESEGYPLASGEAAQAVFDGDFDEVDLRRDWPAEQTLYEWDDNEFQYDPPLDSEEGEAAAEEWEDDNTDADNRWA
ncbi:MysB family protein [Pantoea sp. 1.19]|uniref:MysB family protein n=1 Tax=Pantoea sp. 1.19 TaxID=1925589 RepID=UPI000948C4FF|nr:MysB family protein [Pantoea sp. 1.19]